VVLSDSQDMKDINRCIYGLQVFPIFLNNIQYVFLNCKIIEIIDNKEFHAFPFMAKTVIYNWQVLYRISFSFKVQAIFCSDQKL
jgi:hypothetical protein